MQLLTLSALALIGVVLLWRRWRALPRWQRRRPAQIVINCFSLSLVMLAALLIAGAFQLPGFEIIRLATFATAGLAPLAFLAGLLDARLAKAGVSELLVQLRASPAPDLQELLAQALRDPTLSLIYWLPQYGSWADQNGNPTTLPEPDSGRRVTVVEQHGEQIAALVYDATLGRGARAGRGGQRSRRYRLGEWPARSGASGAAAGTARLAYPGGRSPTKRAPPPGTQICTTARNNVW